MPRKELMQQSLSSWPTTQKV